MRAGGDVDYDSTGQGYATQRRPDPRIAAAIEAALGDAQTVVNVGAGAGSYEPAGRRLLAVEPSAVMRAQRPPGAAIAIHAYAEALPLDDGAVDAAMAVATVHQWADRTKGLAELRRVARGPVVVLAFDGPALGDWWLNDYAPELIAAEQRRYPDISQTAAALGSKVEVRVVPIPIDCTDGFTEAFYGRPERLLDPAVRRAQSSWGFVGPEVEPRFVARLSDDLDSGRWDERYGAWRRLPAYEGSVRLLVGWP
ncbi:methyltransferase domain-containing protein [Phenylobacterium sp.]|uniref:class I SAM-dependent methyltransferase n=1 Tax=Phenylobacterium sp. TaxID=1871053 RepID=UPI0025D837CB|nr:methyltransferase domain-containing protein [Phenylobacterium sp.]